MTGTLSIWTVYERPLDYPDCYVARRHQIEAGYSVATPEAILSDTLEPLRGRMLEMGLTCLPRQEGDDPHIVESWI